MEDSKCKLLSSGDNVTVLMDIERQRLNTKIDRLVQRMAMLEQSVEEHNVVRPKFTNTESKSERKVK